MRFKERIERLKAEEQEKQAEKRARQLRKEAKLEKQRREKKEKFLRATENWKLPEIMEELNEECLGGRGRLRKDFYPNSTYFDEYRLELRWDENDDIKYIYAQVTIEPGGFFTKEKLELFISRVGTVTSYDRDSLEEAFAKAFLHPGSQDADDEYWRQALSR